MNPAHSAYAGGMAASKNPEKLTGPEKVRFLSVLSKDPQLQVDVIAHLREIDVLAPSIKDRVAEVTEKLPPPMQDMVGRADELAESATRYVRENHSIQTAKERVLAGARKLGR